mmetsp:Transcript_32610/g.50739  ORF Transcript_32610/g.50739 Transcript_32610/m.50739 type:complete len:80 (+) Transcript_32610:1171-1410(+)
MNEPAFDLTYMGFTFQCLEFGVESVAFSILAFVRPCLEYARCTASSRFRIQDLGLRSRGLQSKKGVPSTACCKSKAFEV